MPYFNKADKPALVALIKPILKKYNLKGTISIVNYDTVNLNIKSGAIDFISGSERQYKEYWHATDRESEVVTNFLKEAFEALQSFGWYDKSEAQVDYFDIAYYTIVKIGKYDTPYVLTA